jgi:hypothetical protein
MKDEEKKVEGFTVIRDELGIWIEKGKYGSSLTMAHATGQISNDETGDCIQVPESVLEIAREME